MHGWVVPSAFWDMLGANIRELDIIPFYRARTGKGRSSTLEHILVTGWLSS
jgi:hypothetical protein